MTSTEKRWCCEGELTHDNGYCVACHEKKTDDVLLSPNFVRCPKCRNYWPGHCNFKSGKAVQNVQCQRCQCRFQVNCYADVKFESPAMIQEVQ